MRGRERKGVSGIRERERGKEGEIERGRSKRFPKR